MEREEAGARTPTGASLRRGCEETVGLGVCAPRGDRAGPRGRPVGSSCPSRGSALPPCCAQGGAAYPRGAWLVPTNQLAA